MNNVLRKQENTGLSSAELLAKANRIQPVLYERWCMPCGIVNIGMGKLDYEIIERAEYSDLGGAVIDQGESVCFDFGEHIVGYFEFEFQAVDTPMDAPAHLRIKFGETIFDIAEVSETYSGELSGSWIQEERIHIDFSSHRIQMPRRYAFRYVEITALGISCENRIRIKRIRCRAVTSADTSVAMTSLEAPKEIRRIDEIAIATLRDCMQNVFEDGPKRDRRLWLGDLRLQALTNYKTFRNLDLVKRCLYLFAGAVRTDGWVAACLFLEPGKCMDGEWLFDYALLFITCLYEYYSESHDEETLRDLWPVAYRQACLAEECLGNDDVVSDRQGWWCFLDWNSKLNKQAGAHAVLIYTLRHALILAKLAGTPEQEEFLFQTLRRAEQGALCTFWDDRCGFFVSGAERQVSWASQIWFALAGVLPDEQNAALLRRTIEKNPNIGIVTPYLYHHLLDALIQCGERDEAFSRIKGYWGKMAELGVDCFWEAFDPKDPNISPYGSRVINSYCHAWSCTPSYLFREYFY